MGMEIELESTSSPAVRLAFMWVEYLFTLVFSLELCLRSVALGCCKNFFGKEWYWSWLDLVVLSVALLDLGINLFASNVSSQATSNVTVLRLLRLLRVTRIARVLRVSKLVRFVTPLRGLLFSIFSTFRHLVWSLVLLLMLIYSFALLFAKAVSVSIEDLEAELQVAGERHWGGLLVSMMTLFQAVTGGVTWKDCSEVLKEISPILEWIFVVYISITVFAVLNVVTGSFCHSAMEAAARDPTLLATTLITKKEDDDRQLQRLFKKIDCDGSGKISYSELKMVLGNSDVRAGFEALRLEVNDAWTLFKLLDAEQSDMIDVEQFIMGCKQLRGDAKTMDLATLSYELKWLVKKVAILVDGSERQPWPSKEGVVPRPAISRPRMKRGSTDILMQHASSRYPPRTSVAL